MHKIFYSAAQHTNKNRDDNAKPMQQCILFPTTVVSLFFCHCHFLKTESFCIVCGVSSLPTKGTFLGLSNLANA